MERCNNSNIKVIQYNRDFPIWESNECPFPYSYLRPGLSFSYIYLYIYFYFQIQMSCTLIALHHGRKTKNKSFASCRGRVNISGSSKIAWINVEFNGNSLSVAVPSKVKSVCGPVRLLLFLRDKFVVRRQFRFRKNRNCSLARESICYGDKILLMIDNDHKQCNWHF